MKKKAVSDRNIQYSVDRAIDDLRRGVMVVVNAGARSLLVYGAEFVKAAMLKEIQTLAGNPCRLVITPVRARRLGIKADSNVPYALPLTGRGSAALIEAAVHGASAKQPAVKAVAASKGSKLECAALRLAKLASLLPAVLVSPIDKKTAERLLRGGQVLRVRTTHIDHYKETLARSLVRVSEASVPLEGGEDARVIAFRPRFGMVEHLAILIGQPEKLKAPLVRVHSSCITGDVLGSLRCDCGDQLRGAIQYIGKNGGGVILYLNQEGRGIGIASKLRAYALQDGGLDTVDANEEMGFNADEREFELGAEMLKSLGISRIRLLTNNPRKLKELERYGIYITQRVGLVGRTTKQNQLYLTTKAQKLGHLF